MNAIPQPNENTETPDKMLAEFARRVTEGRPTADLFGVNEDAMMSVLHQAHTLYVNKRFDDALVLARGATALDETSAYAQLLVGDILFQAKEYDEAMAYLEKAHELDPSHVLTQVKLGEVYLRNDRVGEAKDVLEGVVHDLEPGSEERKRTLALLLVAEAKERS